MQSRLYYFSIGGLAIVLAAASARVRSDARIFRVLSTMALAVPVVAFGWLSRESAAAFAARTAASRPLAESIATAVDRAATAGGARCRIVVLGVAPPPEWSLFVSADSIAKALSANPDRIGRCFVEADYPTYFNLMRSDATPADAEPYVPHAVDGRAIDWLRLGDLKVAYLDPPATVESGTLDGIVFLRYIDGALVDVTDDVIAGRIPVSLR